MPWAQFRMAMPAIQGEVTGGPVWHLECVTPLIRGLQRRLGITSIVVTHDLESALRVSDRLALRWEGQIVAMGPPHTLQRPPDERVRGFLSRYHSMTHCFTQASMACSHASRSKKCGPAPP
jgi:ABC-type transporter Mla maintaining outer membrane lipid asymmetry ATPase subunit MlaF